MMELKSPTAKILHIEISPTVFMEITINTSAPIAKNPKTLDGLFLLVLGGIGMIIPTPGGVGSYHAIVMIGLSVLGVGKLFLGENGDPSNPALLFPTIVHIAQTLVAIIMGSISLLLLFLSKKKQTNE